ncbi:zf-TFIIB domain-containing protein [bacterium]|nr:zf-TFIIB domain-containing protein [bacterium]
MRECPECNVDLIEKNLGDCLIDYCKKCHGYFFDSKELEKVSTNQRSQQVLSSASQKQKEIQRRVRNCPACNFKMSIKEKGDVEIDRCLSCGGIWLDGGEFEKISQMIASETEAKAVRAEKAQNVKVFAKGGSQRPLMDCSPQEEEQLGNYDANYTGSKRYLSDHGSPVASVFGFIVAMFWDDY